MKYMLLMLFIGATYSTRAQEVTGRVTDDANGKDPLVGATVFWMGTTEAVSADQNGAFKIKLSNAQQRGLVVSFVGYKNDTVYITDFSKLVNVRLKKNAELKEVVVEGKRDATVISTIKTKNTELITEKELLKAACCNLSESFETNPTIDVNYTDAVTGAREIQMLGLSGIYTQLLTEAIPAMRGLGTIFGLNYIPGPWMESIQISKGAGSVANGHEAITGQINVEYKKPEEMKEKMFLNVFADNEGRVEANTINRFKLNEQLNYMLMVHGSMNQSKLDHNDDSFLDMPLTKQLNIYNRLRYNSGKKMEGQFGIKALVEERNGGQVDFDESKHKGTNLFYGVGFNTRRLEMYSKTGMVDPEKQHRNMGLQMHATYHDQSAYFGQKDYDASQKSFYAHYAYITVIGSPFHKIRVGTDFKYDIIKENLEDDEYKKEDIINGLYAEYTFDGEEKIGIIAGTRVDYHNKLGWFVSPRVHFKYNFTPEVVMRISGGSGWRNPNIFADNIGVMASGKILNVLEKPLPEEAWNGGANVTAHFNVLGKPGTIAADYYYTWFTNQYIIDQYSVDDQVLYYNLIGESFAQSLQSTLTYELFPRLDVKLAYKIDDVQTDYLFVDNLARPLFSREKALVNIAYETKRKRWRFDATAQWQGVKPLPAQTFADNHQHQTDTEINNSPDYVLINSQVTRVFKKWELYLGSENVTDFTQHHPIVNVQDPFSKKFDATSIWGPINGRKFYLGLRWTIG